MTENEIPREPHAFPTQQSGEHGTWWSDEGMTLRDYFASKALTGLLTEGSLDYDDDAIAELAYSLADSMMKARVAK